MSPWIKLYSYCSLTIFKFILNHLNSFQRKGHRQSVCTWTEVLSRVFTIEVWLRKVNEVTYVKLLSSEIPVKEVFVISTVWLVAPIWGLKVKLKSTTKIDETEIVSDRQWYRYWGTNFCGHERSFIWSRKYSSLL